MATLSTSELLADVIDSFRVQVPALLGMSTDFKPSAQKLKLDKVYTAHVPTLPTISTYDATTGYAYGAQTANSLLVDVPVKVDSHKHVPIKWSHLEDIANDKGEYEKAIGNAGYVLAKAVVDSVLAKCISRNISYSSTYATADCDVDMVNAVTGSLNTQGAQVGNRRLLLNTAAMNALAVDSRMASRDYSGQLVGGSGARMFKNAWGFTEILEYPDLPSNNGTALTSATAEADDNLITKAAHGLVTGDRVVLTAITNGAGLTQGNTYYVIYASSSTFKLASTLALAQAGTAIDITTDGTSITITPTENLVGLAFAPEALVVMAGVPDDFNSFAPAGIPRIMGYEAITYNGISMAAVSWQEPGTGNLFWSPTLVYGSAVGRQAGSNAAGTKTDKAGHRVISA